MLPPVSLPRATPQIAAAAAEALPPLEPPGTREGSHGLRTGPHAQCSLLEPIANSSRFVFPITIAPAPRSRSTQVASKGLR